MPLLARSHLELGARCPAAGRSSALPKGNLCFNRRPGSLHTAHARRNRRREDHRERSAGGEWWIADAEDELPSTSWSEGQSQNRGSGASSSRAQGSGNRWSRKQEPEQEEDVKGWWELPRPAPGATSTGFLESLEPWQQEQLLVAYAIGKRKVSVLELSANTGLDRAAIFHWMKQFGSRPAAEQQQQLAGVQNKVRQGQEQLQRQQHRQWQQQGVPEVEQQLRQQLQQEQWESKLGSMAGAAPSSSQSPAAGPTAASELSAKQQQLLQKRLSGEARRSLEGVYSTTPYPPRDVVAGLYDLHRLPRDLVLAWFAARRRKDGLPDNPREAKRLAAAAAAAGGSGGVSSSSSSAVVDEESLQALLTGASVRMSRATAQAAGVLQQQQQQGGRQQQQQQLQQLLSARELAALRSALPSPRKFKGAKLQEQLGIKKLDQVGEDVAGVKQGQGGAASGAGAAGGREKGAIEIAGVQFVVRDGAAAWDRRWRTRRSSQGVPAQRLDFQKMLLKAEARTKQNGHTAAAAVGE